MIPWINDKQINKIKSYLEPNHIMLEYGSGGSTIIFSKLVKKYYSIEHDINWYNQVNTEIKFQNINNINYIYCKPNNDIELPVWMGKKSDFKDYINIISKLNIIYDRILIDGRVRAFCAIKAINYIHQDSIIFFHDFFERDRYHAILKLYDIIDKVDSIDNGPSLAVLKKKTVIDSAVLDKANAIGYT